EAAVSPHLHQLVAHVTVEESMFDEGLLTAVVIGRIDHQALARCGQSFHSRSSSSRPPAFGRKPPHCLKKKGTLCSRQASRISRAQSMCITRAFGPLSPPAITQ